MTRARRLIGPILLLTASGALAAVGGGGGGMPWEQGTTAFVDSITGPWAAAIALMAIVVSGAVLVFGGELNAFGRSMFFIILVTSVIMGATQLLPLFTGGAVLPPGPAVSPTESLSGDPSVRAGYVGWVPVTTNESMSVNLLESGTANG